MAKSSGCPPEQWLIQALEAHFPPVPDFLQREFDARNLASDEDEARPAKHAVERFRRLREWAIPLAEAQGLLTDEDVFRIGS